MILVFGKTGQVSKELQQLGTVTALSRKEANLTDPKACADAIRYYSPNAVINAAAFTAVDRAEDEEAVATIINGDAPRAMAEACAELGDSFCSHFQPIMCSRAQVDSPSEATGMKLVVPKNAYGRSKLSGEIGIAESGAIYVILRTSWVFSANGANFIKTMLRLSETRDAVNVVNDQIGGPTPVRAILRLHVFTDFKAVDPRPFKIGHLSF